mmetsp:Transcript_9569/g.14679  ORF Transcript_9569/g.14679 Transcript_9569/m.14679 type:complete len:205 (-) Transcript_9569:392-1006(-)
MSTLRMETSSSPGCRMSCTPKLKGTVVMPSITKWASHPSECRLTWRALPVRLWMKWALLMMGSRTMKPSSLASMGKERPLLIWSKILSTTSGGGSPGRVGSAMLSQFPSPPGRPEVVGLAARSTARIVDRNTLVADWNHAVDPVPVQTIIPDDRTVCRSWLSIPMLKIDGRQGTASDTNTSFRARWERGSSSPSLVTSSSFSRR